MEVRYGLFDFYTFGHLGRLVGVRLAGKSSVSTTTRCTMGKNLAPKFLKFQFLSLKQFCQMRYFSGCKFDRF